MYNFFEYFFYLGEIRIKQDKVNYIHTYAGHHLIRTVNSLCPRSVHLSVGSIGQSVCHNFLNGWEAIPLCSSLLADEIPTFTHTHLKSFSFFFSHLRQRQFSALYLFYILSQCCEIIKRTLSQLPKVLD